MAVSIQVRSARQIIVPIRFERAVTGPTAIDAPDVDERGFAMGTRPATWGATQGRGAMVGITLDDTVRIRVRREDIDADAPLFVTSTDAAVVEVTAPVGGGPLPADGVFQIRGVKDVRNRPVLIQVRLGAAGGPVLGELEPHVFQLHQLRVRVHLVTINGVATTRSADSMVAVFEQINAIWRPCGIEFVYNRFLTRPETINGLAVAGQMTTNLSGAPPEWNEFSQIINLHPDPNRINIYCVHDANEVFGLTFDNTNARPNGYGIVIADNSVPNSNAHELCHYLDNPHHAQENAAGAGARGDIWARRRLMWSPNPWNPEALAHRNDVGYGNVTRGALITVKNIAPADPYDGELIRARRRSLNPY
jgi:hypothetical protein